MPLTNHKQILLSTCYCAPIAYYRLLFQEANLPNNSLGRLTNEVCIEQYEHFHKQTHRNRAHIYSPNGLHPLIIPVRYKNHTAVKDVIIADDYDWQKLHWRTLESAYRNSPYFEFYERDLLPFYEKRFMYLIEFNQAVQEKILEVLGIKINVQLTTSYIAKSDGIEDCRESFHPKKESEQNVALPSYTQVFGEKFGFLPNLSIIDLLFNEGPQAVEYLKNIA